MTSLAFIAVWAVLAVVAGHLWLLLGKEPVSVGLARLSRAVAAAGAEMCRRGARALGVVTGSRSVRLLATGMSIGLVWSVTFWRLVTRGDAVTVLGINDHPLHVESAHELTLVPLRLNVPEFLFHLVARLGELMTGPRIGPVAALVAFTATSYAALVVLLREPSRQDGHVLSRRVAGVVAAMYFFLETPVLIALVLGALPAHTPFVAIHWWGNPTFVASLPFSFLALPLISNAVETSEASSSDRWLGRRDRCTLAAVLVLGTLAKPSFALVLVPALPIYLVALRRCRAVTFWRLARSAMLPTAAVLLWQTWFLGTGQSGEFRSGWTVELFVEPIFGWGRTGPMFWFPFALILLAVWASSGRFLRERSVQLVLVALGIAVPLMLTVRETGDKAGVGNMAVPTQACVAVLLVLALRTLAWECVAHRQRRSEPGRTRPLWVWATGAVLVAMLVSGGLSLLDGSGLIDVPANWELQYQGT